MQITDWPFIAEHFIVVSRRAQPDPSQSIIPSSGADHRLTSRNWSVWDQTSRLALMIFNLEVQFSILSPQADARDWIFQLFYSVRAQQFSGYTLHQSTITSFHYRSQSLSKVILLFDKTSNRRREGKTAALYLGVTRFKSQCGGLLSWVRLLVDFHGFIYRHWNWATIVSFHNISSLLFNNYIIDRDSVVGIATRYGQEGPGI